MVMDRVEVITSVERHRRWSAAEKFRLVAAMDEPGAMVSEIARSEGVDASLLYRWRRQFAAERETAAFVPVRVSPDLNEEPHFAIDHGDLAIEELIDLPLMADLASPATRRSAH